MRIKAIYFRVLIVFIVSVQFYGCSSNTKTKTDNELTNEKLFSEMQKLANNGNPEAQYHIGMFYNNGIGTEKNPKKAFEWFKKSDSSGHPLGSYKLGCYYAGQFKVVPVDKQKALQHKLIAAKTGYSRAQYDVADIYGERNDFANLEKWLKQAADQGHSKSNLVLAAIYESGRIATIKKNKILAYFYFKIAILRSNPGVASKIKKYMVKLKNSMLPDEIKQAEDLVNSWKPVPTTLTIDAYSGLKAARRYIRHHTTN